MFARTVHGIQPKDLRGLVDDGKRQIKSGIVAIVGVTEEGKAGIVVGTKEKLPAVIDALIAAVRAGELDDLFGHAAKTSAVGKSKKAA